MSVEKAETISEHEFQLDKMNNVIESYDNVSDCNHCSNNTAMIQAYSTSNVSLQKVTSTDNIPEKVDVPGNASIIKVDFVDASVDGKIDNATNAVVLAVAHDNDAKYSSTNNGANCNVKETIPVLLPRSSGSDTRPTLTKARNEILKQMHTLPPVNENDPTQMTTQSMRPSQLNSVGLISLNNRYVCLPSKPTLPVAPEMHRDSDIDTDIPFEDHEVMASKDNSTKGQHYLSRPALVSLRDKSNSECDIDSEIPFHDQEPHISVLSSSKNDISLKPMISTRSESFECDIDAEIPFDDPDAMARRQSYSVEQKNKLLKNTLPLVGESFEECDIDLDIPFNFADNMVHRQSIASGEALDNARSTLDLDVYIPLEDTGIILEDNELYDASAELDVIVET